MRGCGWDAHRVFDIAVLRLPENRRSEALITIAKRRMNARQTDLYIEQVLNAAATGRHRISMVKDVRIFVNTIDHAIRLMSVFLPRAATQDERFTAVVVLPTPPFWFAIATILATLFVSSRENYLFHVEHSRPGSAVFPPAKPL